MEMYSFPFPILACRNNEWPLVQGVLLALNECAEVFHELDEYLEGQFDYQIENDDKNVEPAQGG